MRIPTGNFGNVVAQPQQAANVPAGAFVDGSGEAMQRAGAQISGIASDIMEAHTRAKSLRLMAESKNELTGLQMEIGQALNSGELDPADAASVWQERSKKIMAERLKGVGLLQRDVVSAQLDGVALDIGGRVQAAAQKRTQDNIGGELAALGIALEREGDPATASSRYDKAMRAMGPQAGFSPAQIENNVNTFREKAYATQAYALVNGARHNMAALNAVEKRLSSEEFAALDPQRRAVLLNTTAGYKTALEQRALAQAQRAEIAAAKRDRQAAATFGAAWQFTLEGKKLTDAYVQKLVSDTNGTAYEGQVRGLLKSVPEQTAFAMQPLAAQRETIDLWKAEINASGTDPVRDARLSKAEAAYEAAQKDYKADPLRAAVERGVLPELAPLDLSGGVAGALDGINTRLSQAKEVEVITGRPVSPLTSDEAGQVATLLKALPNDQKATTMAQLSKTLGARTMGAVAAQIDSKDRTLALAAAYGDTMTGTGALVSERLLGGEQAINDKRVVPADVTMWRGEIAKEVRGVYATPEMEDAVIDAAVLARADAEVRRDGRSTRKALEAVSGGIIDFNGGRIPLPMGMTEKQFEQNLIELTSDSFANQAPDGNVYVSGKAVPLEDFVRNLPQAVLRHAGNGRYTVSAGAGMVMNGQGQPIIVGVGHGAR